MTPRTSAKSIVLLLATAASALGACSASAATTGGSTAAAGSSVTSATATAEPPIVMSAGTVTLRTSSAALLGGVLSFTGSTPRHDARRTVEIERLEPATNTWLAAASGRVNRHGGFLVRWRTNLLGRVAMRAIVIASPRARTASTDSSPAAEITIYLPARASYYGPGFYGQKTACGQTLSALTIGVANRTLPCGTLVEVSYENQRLTVPVIDRGPYANGADWDLTQAAAQSLGITETVRVGTLIAGSTLNTPTLGLPPEALQAEQTAAVTGGAVS